MEEQNNIYFLSTRISWIHKLSNTLREKLFFYLPVSTDKEQLFKNDCATEWL